MMVHLHHDAVQGGLAEGATRQSYDNDGGLR
jgi:hypothetical protein